MLYVRFGIVKCVRNSSIPIDWIGFRCVSSFRLLLFSNWAEVWDIVMRASGNQSSWIVKNRKKISSFLILVLSLLLECDVFFSCFLRDACLVCVHSFEVFFSSSFDSKPRDTWCDGIALCCRASTFYVFLRINRCEYSLLVMPPSNQLLLRPIPMVYLCNVYMRWNVSTWSYADDEENAGKTVQNWEKPIDKIELKI